MVCGKIRTKATTTKEKEIKQKRQEEEEKIKKKLKEANQEWSDWRFHIYWNKLEWVDPRIRNEKIYIFCVSSKKLS